MGSYSTGASSIMQPEDNKLQSRPPSESALKVDGLVKVYGRTTAVSGVDLSVRSGECLVLLGPSGSGKTTMLKVIAGFELPTSGHIQLNGRDISRLPPSDRGIGMVFQNYALFPHMTVAQNVAYGLRMRRWSAERQRQRVADMLELVQLSEFGPRRPRQLSGGQQQRVALARALAFGPQLLLMDEPLGALDRSLRIEMEHEIRRIQREVGATILYVTHDQEEAMAIADRVAVMRDGHVLACDAPEELYDRPPSAFVGKFFGDRNALPADVVDTLPETAEVRVRCLGQQCLARSPEGAVHQRAVITFLPSSGRLTQSDPDSLQLLLAVTETLYLGDVLQIRGRLDTGQVVTVRLSHQEAASVRRAAQLTVFIPPDSLMVLPDDLDKPA